MKPESIRPIAICLFRNGNRILVSDGIDPETGSPYCRPLGGAIEFGERAHEAVAREIREELGVEIREVCLLGVLENLFTLDGQQGHEIVFVFDARFVDESLYQCEALPFQEEGWASGEARWFDLMKAAQDPTNLVPEALLGFLKDASNGLLTGKPAMNDMHEANRRGWDARSAEYARGAEGIWQRCHREPGLVLDERELHWLGDVAGKRIAVLGSGDNLVVFALAGMGAREDICVPCIPSAWFLLMHMARVAPNQAVHQTPQKERIMVYRIKCEVIRIADHKSCKVGMKLGDTCTIGPLTPEPRPICSTAFLTLYSLANTLRFTERTNLENADGNHDVVCPDGTVTFRLSRIRNESDAL